MAVTLIISVSSVLFGYWAKRVLTLIHRPEEFSAILEMDLWLWQDFWVALRSFFWPLLTN